MLLLRREKWHGGLGDAAEGVVAEGFRRDVVPFINMRQYTDSDSVISSHVS
jgi:hypothetical protein